MVIPASGRLDLHLARQALADNHARLATEEELGRGFAAYQVGLVGPSRQQVDLSRRCGPGMRFNHEVRLLEQAAHERLELVAPPHRVVMVFQPFELLSEPGSASHRPACSQNNQSLEGEQEVGNRFGEPVDDLGVHGEPSQVRPDRLRIS
jgi:hypothetical protein